MSDIQRGNTKHGPQLDEQMEQESRGMVQGHGSPHAEPFRETEPLPDDTDAPEVERAFRHDDGAEPAEPSLSQEAPGQEEPSLSDEAPDQEEPDQHGDAGEQEAGS